MGPRRSFDGRVIQQTCPQHLQWHHEPTLHVRCCAGRLRGEQPVPAAVQQQRRAGAVTHAAAAGPVTSTCLTLFHFNCLRPPKHGYMVMSAPPARANFFLVHHETAIQVYLRDEVYDPDLLPPTCSVPARETSRSGAAGAVGRPARQRCCSRPAPANRAPRTPGTWWVLAGPQWLQTGFTCNGRSVKAYTLDVPEH